MMIPDSGLLFGATLYMAPQAAYCSCNGAFGGVTQWLGRGCLAGGLSLIFA